MATQCGGASRGRRFGTNLLCGAGDGLAVVLIGGHGVERPRRLLLHLRVGAAEKLHKRLHSARPHDGQLVRVVVRHEPQHARRRLLALGGAGVQQHHQVGRLLGGDVHLDVALVHHGHEAPERPCRFLPRPRGALPKQLHQRPEGARLRDLHLHVEADDGEVLQRRRRLLPALVVAALEHGHEPRHALGAHAGKRGVRGGERGERPRDLANLFEVARLGRVHQQLRQRAARVRSHEVHVGIKRAGAHERDLGSHPEAADPVHEQLLLVEGGDAEHLRQHAHALRRLQGEG
eukprot:924230-Prorocentrum_minimum.AAC.4